MSETNSMEQTAGRANQLITAITDAILSTVEVAAERLALASEVARIQTRMAAFGAVLESVAAQKMALAERAESATGPMKALLQRQIAVLEVQELGILDRVGVPGEVAAKALVAADAPKDETPAPAAPTHKRTGRKFERVTAIPSTNGTHAE